jgi:aminoglycoside phosphotransferase (APT) family kinase protein
MVSTTRVDLGNLPSAAWLRSNGVPVVGDVHPQLLAGGRSNLTYLIEDAAGSRYVLRRPPLSHVLQSAHDMGREFRILRSLHGTPVPVPEPIAHCSDPEVIGAPFYVMRHMPGVVLSTAEDGARYPEAARSAASRSLIEILAALHTLDVDAVGLGELSRRDSYSERQLARWLRQFHATTRRELAIIDQVHDRLRAGLPPQRYTGLVHGDYRPGNVLLNPNGTLSAVLDWELATLGDTMADLGWITATWQETGEAELLESPSTCAGFARRADLVDWYVTQTGRDVSDLGWYQAFALWRLACIFEGIVNRYRTGAMGSATVDLAAEEARVVTLAENAAERLATV